MVVTAGRRTLQLMPRDFHHRTLARLVETRKFLEQGDRLPPLAVDLRLLFGRQPPQVLCQSRRHDGASRERDKRSRGIEGRWRR